jgi:hypothetical protein
VQIGTLTGSRLSQFELPGGEKCMGAVMDYLPGEQMSERYGLSLDGEKLPAEYRVSGQTVWTGITC